MRIHDSSPTSTPRRSGARRVSSGSRDAATKQDLRRAQDAVVLPLGEHDVSSHRLRPLDELVLEHDRRHRLGRSTAMRRSSSACPPPPRRCRARSRPFARPRRGCARAPLDCGRRDVRRLRDLQHREWGLLQEAGGGFAERHLTGEHDARHRRHRGRQRRRDARDEDVRPVAREPSPASRRRARRGNARRSSPPMRTPRTSRCSVSRGSNSTSAPRLVRHVGDGRVGELRRSGRR